MSEQQFFPILKRCAYLDESLQHTNAYDDEGNLESSWQKQIEEARAGDGSSEDSIGWVNGC